MHNQQINEVQYYKHLGVYLIQDCSWHKHIDCIKEKAWTRLNLMRKLKYDLDRKALESIYVSFICPVLEYADVLWDNYTQQENKSLRKFKLKQPGFLLGNKTGISSKRIWWNWLGNIRNKKTETLQTVVSHTNQYFHSFLLPAIREWNTLSEEIRNVDTV